MRSQFGVLWEYTWSLYLMVIYFSPTWARFVCVCFLVLLLNAFPFTLNSLNRNLLELVNMNVVFLHVSMHTNETLLGLWYLLCFTCFNF